MTKVSIILPIYNVERYLPRCLDTVVAQTLTDIEIILATDGPESCHQICERYAAADPRVKIVRDPGGYGLAINRSLEIASGQYVGIVETDDWLDLSMFEKLHAQAARYDADLCKAAFWQSFDDERRNFTVYSDIPDGPFKLEDYPRVLSYQPSVWSAIYKKSFLDQHGIRFMEDRISFVDTPFHLETLVRAERIAFVNEPLYYYYQDNPNQSVKSEGKPLDGLMSENHFYERVPVEGLSGPVFEALVFTAALHMKWNYDRLTAPENKKIFWEAARRLAQKLSARPIKYSEFNWQIKAFYKCVLFSNNYSLFDFLSQCYCLLKRLKNFAR